MTTRQIPLWPARSPLQDLLDTVGNAALRQWLPTDHPLAAVQFFVDQGYYPRYAGAWLILQAARERDLAARPLVYRDSDGQTQLAVLCTPEAGSTELAEVGRLPAPQDHIYDFAEAEGLSLTFQGDAP